MHIEEKIEGFLKKLSLLEHKTYIVGFSGGYDSLCLLDSLYKLSQKHDFRVIAAHLNHNWRGEESRNEEIRAREFCISRGIEFYTKTLPENLPHTELVAREERYKFFNEATKEFKANGIFTGHTRSDQVETVLYRIIKGTGTIGLMGIPEVRYQKDSAPVYRAMLDITREDTVNYCKDNGLSPNVDSSNECQDYLRNKIRLSLIPELKTYNKDVDEAIIRLSRISQDDETLINEYIEIIEKKICTDNTIVSKEFIYASDALKRRIILNFLHKNGVEYDFEKIGEILGFIEESCRLKSGNTLSIGINLWLFASTSEIKLIHSIKSSMVESCIRVDREGSTFCPELNKTLKIQEWKENMPDKFPSESTNEVYADLFHINEPLFIRTRRPGDRIQPFGMKEKMKLKKYFINKGIPEFKRDSIPLLVTETEVLWAVGVGISERLRVTGTPSHVLKLE